MQSAKDVALRHLTLLLDTLVLPVSACTAFWLHGALKPWVWAFKDRPDPSDYTVLLYLAVPLWIFLVVVLGLHRFFERRWSRFEVLVELVKLHFLGFFGLTVVLFLSGGVLNRAIVGGFLAVNFAAMFVVRTAVGAYVRWCWTRGETRRAWLLVGTPCSAMRNFVSEALSEPYPPRLVGLLCDELEVPKGLPKRISSPDKLPETLHDQHVDLVIFYAPLHHPDSAGELFKTCERLGVGAAFAMSSIHQYAMAPQVVMYGNTPCITFDGELGRPSAIALKHACDVIAAAVALVALAPLLCVIAAAVWLTMGSPVFFSQERIGRHGRRFRLHKFRTMVLDAESQREALARSNELSGPMFKMKNDPRVTPLGRFLRRCSLDELPQLFNVVLGSMSLVGPRPLPIAEQQKIEGWHRRRLSMKPGITGLWQVSGRSDVDFDEWMQLDVSYVDRWSLRLDLQILLKTFPAVLLHRGAR